MSRKAQAFSEYLALIALIIAALAAMQIYFRRTIQAVVKIAADEVSNQAGGQKAGVADVDYNVEWIEKNTTNVNTTTVTTETERKLPDAAVTYGTSQVTREEGGISFGVSRQRE